MTACSRNLVAAALLLGALPLQGGLAAESGGDSTVVKALLGRIPAEFRRYKVILEPDRNEPEWWAGAPSVARDRTGTFWLACRMRTADSPLVVSTTPSRHFHTWRYSHWMWVHDELWAYAEVARPDESNEIRLFRLPRSEKKP